MRVLVVNAGSSSLKLRLLDADDTVIDTADLPASTDEGQGGEAAERIAAMGKDADAVGHRVVHGGQAFTTPVRLTPDVRQRLGELTDLAPLHQPASLAGIDAVHTALPDLPAVACFDTAFHATLPDAAATYAIPRAWREELGVRRYGFHGLSHAYATRRAAQLLHTTPDRLRTVVCHLGAGASLAAVAGGVSVDTTMGFTPLEGLVMATRSGSVDPGALLWLHQHAHLPVQDITDGLEHHAGLAGLAGTPDMQQVLTRAEEGEPTARLALAVYVHRLRRGIAAMTAALGGLDVLVFTGGVGEHAAPVRQRTCDGLGHLGVRVDPDRNTTASPDADVSHPSAPTRTLVITAREDLEIATATRSVLASER